MNTCATNPAGCSATPNAPLLPPASLPQPAPSDHRCQPTSQLGAQIPTTVRLGHRPEPTSGFKLSPSILLVDAMASQQLPTKAAPTPRKAPPQVATVPTAGHPETAYMWRCSSSLLLCAPAGGGGWRAWEPLAAQIDLEDRTALLEFVAVMSMVPPCPRRVRCLSTCRRCSRPQRRLPQHRRLHRRWRLRRYRPRLIQGRRPRCGPARSSGSHRQQGRRLRARTPRRYVPRHTFGDTSHRRGRRRHLSWEQSRRAGRSSTCRQWKPSRRCLQEAGTPDGRSTLGRRGWGARKAAAGGAPPVPTTIQAGISFDEGRRSRAAGGGSGRRLCLRRRRRSCSA